MKKRNKNNLPIFDSDHDLLKAFEKKVQIPDAETQCIEPERKVQINKHGVQVLEHLKEDRNGVDTTDKEDFAELLEEYYKKRKERSLKKPSPMPVKKRLKRYPSPEVELDLHGYTTIGAQVKARSFIRTAKHQGFFTIRIIVGKGLHSDLGPVLPDVVEDVLREMKKQDLVIWYEWDKKKKSKSGAVIVYLKQFEQFDG